jgi:hypothetical protein
MEESDGSLAERCRRNQGFCARMNKRLSKIRRRPRHRTNRNREHRITYEIVVDAYDEVERALGWYYYLENVLQFPFQAECTVHRSVSPLRPGDKADVVGMPPEEECMREMFVTVRWMNKRLAVPLSQLRPLRTTPITRQAVDDWHYWIKQGYQF